MKLLSVWCGIVAGCALAAFGSAPILAAEMPPAKAWQTDSSAGQKAWEKNQLFDAEKFYAAAVQDAEKFGPADSRLSSSLNSLGKIQCDLGRLEEGSALLRRGLTLDDQYRGSNKLATVRHVLDLAVACGRLEQFQEADALYDRAQAGMARLFGSYDRTVGICLLDHGNLLVQQARWREAEPMLQEALRLIDSPRFKPYFVINRKITANVQPPNPGEVSAAWIDLGLLYRKEKKFDEANVSLKRALALDEHWFGRKSVKLVTVLNDLALVYADQQRFAEAEPLLVRSLNIMASSAPDHPLSVQTSEILDQVRRAEGKAPTNGASSKP